MKTVAMAKARKPEPPALSRCQNVVKIISNHFELELWHRKVSKFRRGPDRQIERIVGRQEGPIFERDNSPAKTNPRHLAIFLAWRVTGWSLPELGRFFRRHHTSVQNSIRRARKLMAERPDYKRIVTQTGREVTGDRRWEP